jgi:hypothetical protein
MNIKNKFLELTNHTYPHGNEELLFKYLPKKLKRDEFGNLYYKIGDSDVMFTSHLDTATSAFTPVNHVFDGDIIKTDGKSILGADDKAGVTVMLYMIERGVPGLYYFFLGEEVGCVGSKKVATKHREEKLDYINKVVSFDRRGTDSVITFQASQRCCSDEFGKALSEALNGVDSTFKYRNDPTGVYTDSAKFVDIYPECTNISVGYYSEHTFSERQDISHLEKLAEACTKIDWNSLPTVRDPKVTEWDYYGGYGWEWAGYDMESSRRSGGSSTKSTYSTYVKDEPTYFVDIEYNYVSKFKTSKTNGEYTLVDIAPLRVADEKDNLYDFLLDIELSFSCMKWDGLELSVTLPDGRISKMSRKSLVEYLPELDIYTIMKKDIDRNNSKPVDLSKTYAYPSGGDYDDWY